jgi:hypothetical protein
MSMTLPNAAQIVEKKDSKVEYKNTLHIKEIFKCHYENKSD